MPKNISEIRSFLVIDNYCREFIQSYATIAVPLYALFDGERRKGTKIIRKTEKTEISFKNLKNAITDISYRVLLDFSEQFILITDASDLGIGAVLAQKDKNGKEK